MLAKLDVEKSLLTKEIFDRIKGGKVDLLQKATFMLSY